MKSIILVVWSSIITLNSVTKTKGKNLINKSKLIEVSDGRYNYSTDCTKDRLNKK